MLGQQRKMGKLVSNCSHLGYLIEFLIDILNEVIPEEQTQQSYITNANNFGRASMGSIFKHNNNKELNYMVS